MDRAAARSERTPALRSMRAYAARLTRVPRLQPFVRNGSKSDMSTTVEETPSRARFIYGANRGIGLSKTGQDPNVRNPCP